MYVEKYITIILTPNFSPYSRASTSWDRVGAAVSHKFPQAIQLQAYEHGKIILYIEEVKIVQTKLPQDAWVQMITHHLNNRCASNQMLLIRVE